MTAVIIGIIALFILGLVFGYIASGAASVIGVDRRVRASAAPQRAAATSTATRPTTSTKTAKASTKRTKAPAKRTKAAAKSRAKGSAKTASSGKARAGGKDDLKKISGVGPTIEKKLNRMGVKSFAQIAAWSKADIEKADAKLNFKGRIAREKWVSQAKVLARGGETAFSKNYKK